jgi:hypothetical protein
MILWHTCCHVYGRDLQSHCPNTLDAAASLPSNPWLLIRYCSVVALEEDYPSGYLPGLGFDPAAMAAARSEK